jgi:hypothetical protein
MLSREAARDKFSDHASDMVRYRSNTVRYRTDKKILHGINKFIAVVMAASVRVENMASRRNCLS